MAGPMLGKHSVNTSSLGLLVDDPKFTGWERESPVLGPPGPETNHITPLRAKREMPDLLVVGVPAVGKPNKAVFSTSHTCLHQGSRGRPGGHS